MVHEIQSDRYRELFERSADAILVIVEGKFVDCNAATVKMLRYKNKQNLLDTHPSQLSPDRQPDGRLSFEKANEMIVIALEKGSHRFEWDHRRADGEIFPVEVLLTSIMEGEQNTIHVVWREIAYRKKVEKELRRLTSIIESTSDMVSTSKPDGQIQYINNAGLKMLGWKQENLSKKYISDLHPKWAMEIVNQGIPVAINKGIWLGETAVSGNDGREIPVSQVIMAHKSPQGDLEYLSTIIRDISDRKKTEKNLQNNLNLLNSIIENQPTCVKLIRFDGTLLDMNPAGLTMIAATSKTDVVGKNVYNLIDEADRESFREFNEKVCHGGKSTLNYKINALDGSTHHMESIAVPLHYGPKGETVQLGITLDVTHEIASQAEKIKLESQLRQAQKMESIGTLAGGIAHDFNNILAAVMGYTELAMLDADNPDSLRKDLDEILSGANRAKELVKQILTFSRKSDQQLKPLKVQLIIKEVLKLLRSSIPTTIEIKENIDSDCQTVLAAPTQIHQIIMNLCTNAYHAMRDKGGILGISLQPIFLNKKNITNKLHLGSGPYIKLEVSDSGSGMTKDILEKIFEPYFTTKGKGEGTGLGLAVVHGIITSLKGEITVHSEAGRGTTFNAYLPTVDTIEQAHEEISIPLPTGNEHILIVDDSEVIVKLNTRILEKLGYKITAQLSSVEAVKMFEKDPDNFDLVITDMTMPKMTGTELAQKILSIRPKIPIILCSGYSEMVNTEHAKDIGIRDYIMKPVNNKDFVTTIRKLLDEP